MPYYSVYATHWIVDKNEKPRVLTDKKEALEILKRCKDGRLKVFKNIEDATNYAETGYEDYPVKYADLQSPPAVPEKAPFRAPTRHELVAFRKNIEQGLYDVVKKTIWDNPRFLFNSGDTPTCLKEGCRYNALHICAISKNAKIAELILSTISDPKFVELLHGNRNNNIYNEISEILLDYYLNMPEKGRNDTPLHLAAKYGVLDLVEVLTSYPQCKMIRNSHDQLPKNVICSRIKVEDKSSEIAELLEERFFVPVLRSVDDTIPPVIGEPFLRSNPPELNSDPMSPEVKIHAYAGPMTKNEAQTFRRRWKTPPRTNTTSPNLANVSCISPIKFRSSTPTKSINNNNSLQTPIRANRSVCFTRKEFDIQQINGTAEEDSKNGNHIRSPSKIQSITESGIQTSSLYTPIRCHPKRKELFYAYRDSTISFDSNSSSIDSPSNYSHEINSFNNSGFKERHLKLIDTEKGLELIGREIAADQGIQWTEYWDFLGKFINIASGPGLMKLEEFLSNRHKNEDIAKITKTHNEKDELLMNNLCSALDNLGLCIDNQTNTNTNDAKINLIKHDLNEKNCTNLINNGPLPTMPYLCIEKALQVFAKRMTKTILYDIKSIVSIHDAFVSELKRLKALICSFKEDNRFKNVDFSVVHSRFSNLICFYLKSQDNIGDNVIETINKYFQKIIISQLKLERTSGKNEQLLCVCELILDYLNKDNESMLPENLKAGNVCMQAWKNELKCSCLWDTGVPRHVNRKKRIESIGTPRRLFDNDTNDSKNDNDDDDDNDDQKTLSSTNFQNGYKDSYDCSSSDNEVFWSDIDSNSDDDEQFYTPSESPSMFDLVLDEYNIYLMGNEPSKRDFDVLNAICNCDISEDEYPYIYRWKTALMRFSAEDQEIFLSPPVVYKARLGSNLTKEDGFVKTDVTMSPIFKEEIPGCSSPSPSHPSNDSHKFLICDNVQ